MTIQNHLKALVRLRHLKTLVRLRQCSKTSKVTLLWNFYLFKKPRNVTWNKNWISWAEIEFLPLIVSKVWNELTPWLPSPVWITQTIGFILLVYSLRVHHGLLNIEYLENKKSFLDEIKNIFHNFWRAFIWWKNKNLINSSGYKL